MGISQAREDVGCSNCRGVYIKGVTKNCKSCDALFKRIIRKPLKKAFGNRYDMKFIRNHVIVYNNDKYNARLASKIIADYIGFRRFDRGTHIKHGNHAVILLKSAASTLAPDDCDGQDLEWFGLSFKIIPWSEITCDLLSE